MGIIKRDLKYSSLKRSYCNSLLSTVYMLTGQHCNFPHLEKLFFLIPQNYPNWKPSALLSDSGFYKSKLREK